MPKIKEEIETAALTDRGKRSGNQDRYLIRFLETGLFLALADGMGGAAGGDVAASLLVEDLEKFKGTRGRELQELVSIVKHASEKILAMGAMDSRLEGMGTTLTAAFICNHNLFWLQVGDSRLYLYRARDLHQITRDQTLVQGLVDENEITEEDARNHPARHMLDQCVGCPDVAPATGVEVIRPEDLIILSTDGFHGALTHEHIRHLIKHWGSVDQLAHTLMQTAIESGATDNITLVLAVLAPAQAKGLSDNFSAFGNLS